MLSQINFYLKIEGLFLLIIIILILLYYLRKNINPIVFLLVLITWLFNAYIIVLVPYDIYLSNYEKKDSLANEIKNTIRILYSIIYWTIMVNSWVLIPLLSKYEGSGYFTKKEKLFYSIKSNLLFYGIIILIGVALFALAYYKLKEEYINYFLKNCFNFTYLYGFFFLILLLGYSIPNLPKNIYERIFYEKEVKKIENNTKNLKKKLDKVNKDLLDGYYNLVDIKEQIEINLEMNINNLKGLEEKIINKKSFEDKIRMYSKFITKIINYIKKNENVFGIKINKFQNKSQEISMKNVIDKIAALNINLKENEWDNLRIQYQIQTSYNDWCFLKTVIIKGKKYKSSLIDQALRESKIQLMENEDFIPINDISTFKILFYMKVNPIILFFLLQSFYY